VAVVLGWLYEHSASSLFVVLFHTVLNMGSATRGAEGFVAAMVTTVVIVWAVRILRAEHLAVGSARSAGGRRASERTV
jgi:hypothetical protein